MSKKPENPNKNKKNIGLLSIFMILSFGQVVSMSQNSVKKVIAKPILMKKAKPIKASSFSNKLTKKVEKVKLQEKEKVLFHRPEVTENAADLTEKIMYTSYDARIVNAKQGAASISALKSLPLPQLSFNFVNNMHGLNSSKSFLSDKNSPKARLDNNGSQREALSLQVTFDMGSALMGLASTLTDQQLAKCDGVIQYSDLYFNVCKAMQSYCSNLRRLWDCMRQVEDFRKDDVDMQQRYKVGSISGISALQSKERLNTAIAKREEARINLIIAEKKLRQYTPNITKADLETLESLAKVNFKYTKEDVSKFKGMATNDLPGVLKARARMRKSRIVAANATSKGFLPTVSIEAGAPTSYPNWVEDASKSESNVSIKASWTMGVQTIADIGANVLESRRMWLEAEKEIQQAKTELTAAIGKYEQSIMVVELCDSKYNSCKVRLAQHEAMDQNEPEAHLEKRSKFKEELYKAKSELEEAKEKLAIAFLECMLLSGNILKSKDFSNQVAKYNNNFKPEGYVSRRRVNSPKKKEKSEAVGIKTFRIEKKCLTDTKKTAAVDATTVNKSKVHYGKGSGSIAKVSGSSDLSKEKSSVKIKTIVKKSK